jgi:hypothetical protein
MSARKIISKIFNIEGLRWFSLDINNDTKQGVLITTSNVGDKSKSSSQFIASLSNIYQYIRTKLINSGDIGLVDGQGTTVNGLAVDLGGTVTETVTINNTSTNNFDITTSGNRWEHQLRLRQVGSTGAIDLKVTDTDAVSAKFAALKTTDTSVETTQFGFTDLGVGLFTLNLNGGNKSSGIWAVADGSVLIGSGNVSFGTSAFNGMFYIDNYDSNGIATDEDNWIPSYRAVKAYADANKLVSYTVATLPSGTTGEMIYVSDETGGAIPAFYDGTNWRRVTDRAIVS